MIDLSFDPDADAVIFQITGQGDLQEYRDAIAKLLTQPYFHMNLNTIWDLREAVASDRTVEDLRLAASLSKRSAHLRGTSWKTAIVVAGDLGFGLARMFEVFADGAPYLLGIFRTMEEACVWIKSPLEEKSKKG
ncbi:MAG: hypothetical protein HW407_1072 [Bacteroidetes bacterium]|nr:hypothetical protein [Bacteroidota bacterium]